MARNVRCDLSSIRFALPSLSLRLGHTVLTWDASWLVVVPASLWAAATLYVPILGAFLQGVDAWAVAALGVLLCGASLVGHVLAHVIVARALGSETPPAIPLYPLGDAAQVWPAAPSAPRELGVAVAGPCSQGVLAGVAYLLWNTQFHPYLNVGLPLVIFFNGALAIINLMPVYPLDGGRLLRAIGWGLWRRPAQATRWAVNLGGLLVVLLIGWALYLVVRPAYFSAPAGIITLIFAGLLLLGGRGQPARPWDPSRTAGMTARKPTLLRVAGGWLLLGCLLGLTVSLVPTLGGLEIPGVAPSVAPMVEMPTQYRHPFAGKFILTTVLLQTPITVGEWVLAHGSSLVKLVPPEQIVPPDTTAQKMAQQQYGMLEESETTAIAVGLRLAGYAASVKGNGVQVVSLLPESAAQTVLRPGDVIIGVDGEPIGTPSELTTYLRTRAPYTTVALHLVREGRQMEANVPLMPAAEQNGPPRIGIRIAPAGLTAEFPFPIQIVPQKIVGGPSAGLLFTLTVYNLATPGDLTGGRTIAGTGTIDLDGNVGPIGGVAQKVVGAEVAGAEYFLCPPENYADAVAAARRIHVVQVATAAAAIQFLRSLPAGTALD